MDRLLGLFVPTGWPDTVVALGVVLLLIRSALRVITSANAELSAAT